MSNLPQSRRTSTELIECPQCKWAGEVKDTIHSYVSRGMCVEPEDLDVEPVDLCPQCREVLE